MRYPARVQFTLKGNSTEHVKFGFARKFLSQYTSRFLCGIPTPCRRTRLIASVDVLNLKETSQVHLQSRSVDLFSPRHVNLGTVPR